MRKGYVFQRTICTNISKEYLNDSGTTWGVWEAVRESIQNMMDEAEYMADSSGGQLLDYCSLGLTPSKLVLRDKGRGVDFAKILLIGESGKRGTHYRGQKGEGELLSFLVTTREGIAKEMYSKDWGISTKFRAYEGNEDYQVLTLDLYRCKNSIQGTIWEFEATPPVKMIYERRFEYFSQLSRREVRRQRTAEKRAVERDVKAWRKYQDRPKPTLKTTSSNRRIFSAKGPSKLYIKGIYVKDLNSLFSYNFDFDLGRDRNLVDEWKIFEGIRESFESSASDVQMQKYWKEATPDNIGFLEYHFSLTLRKNQERMAQAFKRVYGKRACVQTDRFASIDASSFGWKPVNLITSVMQTATALGLPIDRGVLGYAGLFGIMKQPSAKIISAVSLLEQIASVLGLKSFPIIPVNHIIGIDDENVGGMFSEGKIYILKHKFEEGALALLQTFLHETAHGETGEGDGCRGFTRWFEENLVTCLTGSMPKVKDLIDKLHLLNLNTSE